jgi:hypothetical protein
MILIRIRIEDSRAELISQLLTYHEKCFSTMIMKGQAILSL